VELEEVARLQPPPPPRISARPLSYREERKPLTWVIVAMALVVATGAIAAVIWQATQDNEVVVSVPTAAAEPAPTATADEQLDLDAVDPTLVFGDAKAQALRWNADATLIRIEVRGMRGKAVNVRQGGRLDYLFGMPVGPKLGPGAVIGSDRLRYSLTNAGPTTDKLNEKAKAVGVADPVCPSFDAYAQALASGLPADATVILSYALNTKLNRSVWTADVEGQPELKRTMDGRTCAVVVR
jgi:hypothetical protein